MGKVHRRKPKPKPKPKVLAVEWFQSTNKRGNPCYVEMVVDPNPSAGPSTPRRSQGQAATPPSTRAQLDTGAPVGSYDQDWENSVPHISHSMPQTTKVRQFADSSCQQTLINESGSAGHSPVSKFIFVGLVAISNPIPQ